MTKRDLLTYLRAIAAVGEGESFRFADDVAREAMTVMVRAGADMLAAEWEKTADGEGGS